MRQLFDDVSYQCSEATTKSYSTSFSLGIKFIHKDLRNHVYGIYGFVRFADEIVDTLHEHNKRELLGKFRAETFKAIEDGVSMNPILNAFQKTVRAYNIDLDLIHQFLNSMEMDLDPQDYNRDKFEEYIYGSAEVVGLMCLHVFCYGDKATYKQCKPYAIRLGAAFQKINFLRDLKEDYESLGRSYFPGVDLSQFNNKLKAKIEEEIEKDFKEAYKGILMLPKSSRFGVYIAYVYYYQLFRKIKTLPAEKVIDSRIRIPNNKKYMLFVGSYVRHSFNLI